MKAFLLATNCPLLGQPPPEDQVTTMPASQVAQASSDGSLFGKQDHAAATNEQPPSLFRTSLFDSPQEQQWDDSWNIDDQMLPEDDDFPSPELEEVVGSNSEDGGLPSDSLTQNAVVYTPLPSNDPRTAGLLDQPGSQSGADAMDSSNQDRPDSAALILICLGMLSTSP